MDREVFVHVDLNGIPYLVGRLWGRTGKGKEGATFEYDERWLTHGERFALEPALALDPGPFHTPADLPIAAGNGFLAPGR
jgi:hypothetical protein